MLSWNLRIICIIICIFIAVGCSESAELPADATFREDFSFARLSSFKWGFPEFALFKFKADPEMVFNNDGINYLKLGLSDSDMYPSGFIYAKERFSYGSYSARIKVSGSSGGVASFFTCNEIAQIFSDGTHDEIDFEFITALPHSVLMTTWHMATGMEGGQQTATHNSYTWEDPAFDIRDWHVYRFDWFQDRVDFYIDGIKRWTSERAIPQRDMMIALHMYTIDTWTEVAYPPKGEILQMTDWVEYREFSKERVKVVRKDNKK